MRVAFLLVCFLVMGTLACGGGDGEAEKAKALDAARQWADASADTAADGIVQLVIGEVTGASLVSSVIADQIDERVTWSYSDPVRASDGNIYRVTATASVEVEFDLPLLGAKAYEAKLPFNLQVDVSGGEVTRWSPDLTEASVAEKVP